MPLSPVRASEAIQELLARHSVDPPPPESAGAAVLLVLRPGRSEVEALLIERAIQPSDPASGHVSLPGGRYEKTDGSLEHTALRELKEEVGLSRPDLEDRPRYVETQGAAAFQVRVAIFAAALRPEASRPRPRSRSEVATVFWLPRSRLAETVRVPRQTTLGIREVDATVYANHVVWGFTRGVLQRFFARD